MIEANFSRRVGRLMHTPLIELQNFDQRLAFVTAIEKAEIFPMLPVEYRSLILKAEKQLDTQYRIIK